jgi:hypothetical protein
MFLVALKRNVYVPIDVPPGQNSFHLLNSISTFSKTVSFHKRH